MENSLINEEESSAADWWLCLGVMVVPCVFVWFTLLARYSIKSKVLAFAWLIILPVTLVTLVREKVKQSAQTVSVSATPVKELAQWQAAQIMSLYKENKVRADNALKGETIIVTGKVDTIGKDIVGSPYVTLDTDDDFFKIQVYFKSSQVSKLASLNPGQYINLAGRCDGAMGNVIIRDAELP